MADELIQAAGIFEGMNWWTSNNINPVNKSFFSDPLPGYNCSLAGGEIGWSNHNDLMFGGNKTARCSGYYNEDDPLGYLTDVDNVIQKSDDHHQLQPNPVVGCGVVDKSSVQDWSTTDQEAPVVTGETNYYFGGGNGNITATGSVGGDSSNSTREANYYFCGGNGNGNITATGSAGGGGDSSNSSGEGSTITTSDHHYHHQGTGAGPAAGSTSFTMGDHSPSNLFQTLMNNEQLLINPPADPAAIININPADNYQQMINSPCWSTEVGATNNNNNNNKFSGKAAMLANSLEDIRASLFSSPSPSPSPRPLQSHHRQKRPAGFDGCDKPCRGDQRKEKGVNNKAASVSSSKSSSINVEPSIKRPRIETPSSLPTFKVRKEKLGDRITALQQLVSPFGKTDTASVLHEAIVYIKFLHDQVNVLSTSYMKNAAPVQHSNHQQGHNSKNQDEGRLSFDLRSRGLCLVPISSTFPVAHETPADFWTPTFGATFR